MKSKYLPLASSLLVVLAACGGGSSNKTGTASHDDSSVSSDDSSTGDDGSTEAGDDGSAGSDSSMGTDATSATGDGSASEGGDSASTTDDAGGDGSSAPDTADGASASEGGDAASSDATDSGATGDSASTSDSVTGSDGSSGSDASDDSSGSDGSSGSDAATDVASDVVIDVGPVCEGGHVTITGVTLAPNQTDPIPKALVYVADDSTTFSPPPAGVACTSCTVPIGALYSATSFVDGTFTITAPGLDAGGTYTIVVATGGFRRVIRHVVIPPCGHVTLTAAQTAFPGISAGDDVAPKVAVASESTVVSKDVNDKFAKVLDKIGLKYDAILPNKKGVAETGGTDMLTLLSTPSLLNSYNIVIAPCGALGNFSVSPNLSSTMVANVKAWLQAGGRLYASDLAYEVLATADTSDFSWAPGPSSHLGADDADVGVGIASRTWIAGTIVDPDLLAWLRVLGSAGPSDTAIPIYELRDPWGALDSVTTAVDSFGVPYARTFVTGDVSWYTGGGPTTVGPATHPLTAQVDIKGAAGNRCGRAVFTSYHVQSTSSTTTTLTAQERVLEYIFFQLSTCLQN